MRTSVVDRFHPGGEQPVQLGEVGHLVTADHAGVTGDLDQELLPDRAEEPLDLSSALGSSGCGVGEFDAEFRAGAQQPGIHKSAAVIDVDSFRYPPAGQGWA